jgi:microcompartment protein CcmL/EutN
VGDGLVAAHIIARVHSEVENILKTEMTSEVNGIDCTKMNQTIL